MVLPVDLNEKLYDWWKKWLVGKIGGESNLGLNLYNDIQKGEEEVFLKLGNIEQILGFREDEARIVFYVLNPSLGEGDRKEMEKMFIGMFDGMNKRDKERYLSVFESYDVDYETLKQPEVLFNGGIVIKARTREVYDDDVKVNMLFACGRDYIVMPVRRNSSVSRN